MCIRDSPKVPSDPFERLLSKTEDQGGKYFPLKERKTAEPEKYMDGDEKSLQEGKGGSKQSVPA